MFALLSCAVFSEFLVLNPADFKDHFVEGLPCPVPPCGGVNTSTYEWAVENLPFFDTDDEDLVSAYYFRIKTYKSHIIETDYVDAPFVLSEFGPAVHWGGAFGTINAAAGHHIHEGRWIRDKRVMDSEIGFWFGRHHHANGTRGQGGSDAYSSWIISSALERAHVLGNTALLTDLLPQFAQWWEGRAISGPQWRMDCLMDGPNQGKENFPACLSVPPSKSRVPQCFGEKLKRPHPPYTYWRELPPSMQL
jgi:hypothetical protein